MDIKDKVVKTDEQWRRELTPEQYDVLRRQGTERAFTGPYWDAKADGMSDCFDFTRRPADPPPHGK